MKKLSPQAIIALKETLALIYWRKKDLRQFLELTIENSSIISTIDWQDNIKFEIVSQLVDRMIAREDIFYNDLLKLFQETSNFNDFSHLKYWDDDGEKTKRAKEAVHNLRNQTKGYFDVIEELKKSEERRKANLEKIKDSISFSDKLEALKNKFFEVAINKNAQQRGFQFEKLLNELFQLFDLDPKASFKITGEQIDGAFTFDQQDYLIEAKWQKVAVNAGDLYKFGGKISGKLKNTLGLFISLEGFSSECTETNSTVTKSMILMDGQDLMQVLEGRIKLHDLIYIKRRHASQTGEIYYKIM